MAQRLARFLFSTYLLFVASMIIVPMRVQSLDINVECQPPEIHHKTIIRQTSDSLNIRLEQLWNLTFSQSDYDIGYAIVECSYGGYAIVGSTQQQTSSRSDIWLLRIDSAGNLIWHKQFGGRVDDAGYDLVECPDGGFILVGYRDVPTSSFDDFSFIFVVRTDAFGNQLWNRTYNSIIEYGLTSARGYSIIACQLGGFAILGGSDPGWAIHATWLLRINDSGQVLWVKEFPIAVTSVQKALVECQSGGFAFIGQTARFVDSDIQLFRVDVYGEMIWNRTFGGVGDYRSGSLVECSDGGFAFTGSIQELGTLDWDIWLVRTDFLGILRWNRSYGSLNYERGYELIQTSARGFAFTGFLADQYGAFDVKLLMTSSSGNVLVNFTFGNLYDQRGFSIVESQTHGIAILGTTNDVDNAWKVLLIRIPSDENKILLNRLTWIGLVMVLPFIISICIVWLTIRFLKLSRKKRVP
ncbi:MAG: hypothetical protein ACFFD8_05590 [Candidatus Thorarchaeota archaeon]